MFFASNKFSPSGLLYPVTAASLSHKVTCRGLWQSWDLLAKSSSLAEGTPLLSLQGRPCPQPPSSTDDGFLWLLGLHYVLSVASCGAQLDVSRWPSTSWPLPLLASVSLLLLVALTQLLGMSDGVGEHAAVLAHLLGPVGTEKVVLLTLFWLLFFIIIFNLGYLDTVSLSCNQFLPCKRVYTKLVCSLFHFRLLKSVSSMGLVFLLKQLVHYWSNVNRTSGDEHQGYHDHSLNCWIM